MSPLSLSSLLLLLLLCTFSLGDIFECGDFFPITTYVNTTQTPINDEKSTPFLLSLAGSYRASKLNEKISMMVFAVDYINSITTILPGVALQLYDYFVFFFQFRFYFY